jgi:hypothetical protein
MRFCGAPSGGSWWECGTDRVTGLGLIYYVPPGADPLTVIRAVEEVSRDR